MYFLGRFCLSLLTSHTVFQVIFSTEILYCLSAIVKASLSFVDNCSNSWNTALLLFICNYRLIPFFLSFLFYSIVFFLWVSIFILIFLLQWYSSLFYFYLVIISFNFIIFLCLNYLFYFLFLFFIYFSKFSIFLL